MNNEKWTTENIPGLTGKVIIVTGGNSGLGFEAVKAFAEKGAEVVLATRSMEKGEEAKKQILQTGISGKIEVIELDLMNLKSVIKFAEQFKKNYTRLDVLLNNAGIMTTPYFLTKDGFEAQIGTNHLGHFALTGLLMPVIKKSPVSRVVNVSSMAHKQGKMDFENFLFEGGAGYSPLKSYGRSKLSNLLFTYELQRRLVARNVKSIAVSAHPGVSNTNLGRHIENKLFYKILYPLMSPFIQSQEMGALPQIRAAVDPNVKGAEFYGPGGFNEMKGFPVKVQSNSASHNLDDARKLWELSEKLTGVKFEL